MSAEWVEQAVPDNQGIPGKTLAAQRESMGWTVEQVADQLKLAVRQVVALEQGDYANLPGPAVVRGFVRAYAKVVKLDAAPLVAQIALAAPEAGDATSTTVRRDKPASFSQVRFPTHGKRSSKMPMVLGGLVVLLAGAGAFAWYAKLIPASLLSHGAQVAASATSSAASTPPIATLPVAVDDKTPAVAVDDKTPAVKPPDALPPVISNAVPLISVPPPASSSSQTANLGAPVGGVAGVNGVAPAPAPVVTLAPAAPASTSAPAAAVGGDALVINVREDSWVEVRRAKGRPLFSSMVKGGKTETVTITEPVTLIVGKPSAVDATLRGVTLALVPAPGARVARVQLK